MSKKVKVELTPGKCQYRSRQEREDSLESVSVMPHRRTQFSRGRPESLKEKKRKELKKIEELSYGPL